MYILVGIIIAVGILLALAGLYSVFKQKIEFYITGLDAKFSFSDLNLLWNVAEMCDLDYPKALFWSMPSLTKCMSQITSQAAANGTETDPKTQALITKLFNYRTKLQNETDSKKGLESTMYLEKGQKLRIILPGKGVFSSKILNNGKEIIISVPRQKDMIPIPAEQWDGKFINVYLWRKADARYVFDTTVTGHGLFVGESSISLKHSSNLIRTQKRKAVRAKCEIKANLYIIKNEEIDYNAVETQNGYKCLIEDISEAGAMIRIGGKGVPNVQIKLQFNIQNMLIIMFGVVRTVEYNEASNQSLLHFECIHLEPAMKNEVLSYVYNMLPEREKEVYEALQLTDTDEQESAETGDAATDIDAAINTAEGGEGNTDKGDIPVLPEMPEISSDASAGKTQIDPSINIFDDNK
ncbi:MAG: PilZ domain-containing protein [Treponema sp.]|nr:PilZ domain-containing protein [Treponema sp.]